MPRLHRAAWVLPIARPPLRDGWVAVEGARVTGVGPAADLPDRRSGGADAADAPPSRVILPGLVNAHAHLELSWMRDRLPRGTSMPAWAAALIALRRDAAVDPLPAILAAIAESKQGGTSLIGDVANTLATYLPLRDSGLSAVVFRELIGFRIDNPETIIADTQAQIDALPRAADVRVALAPHAPYSVSAPLLSALGARRDAPLAIHLGESAAELELLRSGTGAWREVLDRVGAWNAAWQPPGCGPVDYLDRLGLLSGRLLAVHGVQFTAAELARLAEVGATVVTCPRSNAWTGAGEPPIARFYQSGVRVAIGTDSLASVETLSMFDEMAAVRRIGPAVPAARILRSATLDGAAALGFPDLGTIAPGQRAALIAVDLPGALTRAEDVEEYLVGGIPTSAVHWLGP